MPLATRNWNAGTLTSAPLLIRPAGARRASGLIWPRQFVGTRPATGVLIPRLRGGLAANALTLNGETLNLNGETLILN